MTRKYNDYFFLNHSIGDVYLLRNRDKTFEQCKIAYYPLDYDEPTALVEIDKGSYNDFREIPIRFLTKLQDRNITGYTFV